MDELELDMIPFNDLKAVFSGFEPQLKAVANKVIESGYFVLGPNVKNFETKFANYIGANHCVGVGNGTDALEIGLRSVGVGAGSEVITVANAGGYTTSALINIGAKPLFVDVDENMLISLDSIKANITKNTKCIVATHLYGQAVDIKKLRNISGDIPIVEDCAEAHGARFGDDIVGSLGDVSCFSFYPTKNLGALGDGGAVLCNRDDIFENISLLRQYGWDSKYHSSIPYGRNSRLDELQAGFLLLLLEHIDEMNSKRKAILEAYCNSTPRFFTHMFRDERNVGHLAVAQVELRDGFRDLAKECGVSTDIHFPVLDCNQKSLENIEFEISDLSNSRKFVKNIVSVPCYPGMTSEQIDTVCALLSDWQTKTA